MSEWVFWISAICLIYIYFGYPALVYVAARLCPRPVRKQASAMSFSVVVSAWNEEKQIAAKLTNILQSPISGRLLDVLVASDGSTDGTANTARAVADPRIRVLEYTQRRGKAATLNDVIPECRGEVVVLTDARQELDPNALQNLLAAFADAEVGVVSGELVFRRGENDTTAAHGIGAYWNYEKFIRKQESRFGSVPGATGALYAIRRELFKPIPAVTLLDDVAIPMQAMMQGSRCVFEDQAIVFDRLSHSVEKENIRKRRTIAGNAQLIRLYPGWLLPWRNPVWFQYMSHKLARLLSPFFLVGVFLSNLALLDDLFYVTTAAAQGLFYGVAALGWMGRRTRVQFGLLGLPMTFVALNATTALAVIDAVRGRIDVKWSSSRDSV